MVFLILFFKNIVIRLGGGFLLAISAEGQRGDSLTVNLEEKEYYFRISVNISFCYCCCTF